MKYLKQATAATLEVGPFLDATDGVTPLTGLTLVQADVLLSKEGGALTQKTEPGTATHDSSGFYAVAVDTTDTGTAGRLVVSVTAAGAVPVWADYTVLPAATYDAWITNGVNDISAADVWSESTRSLTGGFTKNTPYDNFKIDLLLEGGAPGTGLTILGLVNRDDEISFSTIAGTITEVTLGTYTVDFTAADLNGDKIIFKFSASGARTETIFVQTDA